MKQEKTKSNVFFTADTHFGHTNIIKYCDRPFANTGEHDAALINNWNSVVAPHDLVFHLGDFCLGNADEVNRYLKRLNGHVWFVSGNHDKGLHVYFKKLWNDKVFAETVKKEVSSLGDYYVIKARQFRWDQDIILMHYAMRVWSKSHHGAWHLYGHSHGSLPDNPHARSIDVGVDCHNYFPIRYQQVKQIMDKKFWQPLDHHGEREEGGGIGLSKEDYEKLSRARMYEQLKKEFEK